MIEMRFAILAVVLLFLGCTGQPEVEQSTDYYAEQHRPQFHFTPEKQWMNDPNGMVYYDGEYHLFYQHYPDSNVWGPMHWGHAISTDLVHWEHLPIALYPDEHGLIFSGSAVIDWNNTSGFGEVGKPPMVAIFSFHDMEAELAGEDDRYQTQGLAYSNDRGRTWTKYEANPVLENPGVRDFRDPKVIWHEESQKWVMALAVLDHLRFYGSENLKEWTFLSEFGREIGSHDGVWECPDLFPIIDDRGNERWVLIENMNPGNPNGGSGTQYFIGHFDGTAFSVADDFMPLLATHPKSVPEGEVFADFENGLNGWSIDGNAFSRELSAGSGPGRQKITGFIGSSLANSFAGGDKGVGRMTSPEFTIDRKAINFLIGGGNHRGRTFAALEVDGQYVRLAEGRATDDLDWKGWEVGGYAGQRARIVIEDKHTRDWGHIMLDQITFADEIATPEQTGSVWLDAGMDNYAGVTWSDVPASDGRRIFLGWMSNWAYAQVVPTAAWRSAMTIPWKLEVKHYDDIPRLVGCPVEEMVGLRIGSGIDLTGGALELSSPLADIDLEIGLLPAESFSITLSNEVGEQIEFSFDQKSNELLFDRRNHGDSSFSSDFGGVHRVIRNDDSDAMNLRILTDVSSIEIFVDGGANVFTETFFPSVPYQTLTINATQVSGTYYELDRIW